jgi:hypothetical protein
MTALEMLLSLVIAASILVAFHLFDVSLDGDS